MDEDYSADYVDGVRCCCCTKLLEKNDIVYHALEDNDKPIVFIEATGFPVVCENCID
jgi:hypothetical protein